MNLSEALQQYAIESGEVVVEPELPEDGDGFELSPLCGPSEYVSLNRLAELERQQPEVLGCERYRVEKTGHGFWPYCVRAGDGTRELFVGYLKQCERVAAQLASAFEDGKFVARPVPAAQAGQVPECFRLLLKHAHGMTTGVDWNKGTAAGYHREPLGEAVVQCQAWLAAAPQP